MVLTMYGGGTPQSTSQVLSVPAYVRKKELNPGRKIEPRKSWEECVKKDLERCGLRREDAYDRVKWREHIKAKIANPGQPG